MGRYLTKEIFVSRAKRIHGDKYDYSKVNYVDLKTKVCIICPIHGEFWQKPVDHLRGAGGNIVKCLKQQTKTAYGYKWKYVD